MGEYYICIKKHIYHSKPLYFLATLVFMDVVILVSNVKSNLADCHRAFENNFPTNTNRNVNIIKPENKIKTCNYL